ncbi:MAG: type II secretion system F family protein [Micrococcales bacterium]|nr:type II secretion system F family protein [Micrococcales bacterium]
MAAMTTGARAFEYTARDSSGKLSKGRIEAGSEGAIVEKLRGLGLAPVTISESVKGTGLRREISLGSFGKGVDLKTLAVFARQMATMISAGLSLLKTLSILTEQADNKKLKEILTQVTRQVETGGSLSDAMGQHPVDFPPLMINMVRAGETGGFLEGALDSVATNFEKEAKLRATIKSAMTYPVVVLSMAGVGVLAMLLFIVPVFKTMFASLGSALPAPTQILVNISNALPVAIPVLIVAIVAFSAWWRINKNTEAVRSKIDPIRLKLPVFGALNKKIAIARFTRNMANMLAAGVPIMQALLIVGETSGNYVLEKAARSVSDAVRQGRSIAGPLAEESVFPPMVTQMVAVGEDSGSLETMLGKVAEFYDSEVEATTKALTSLIEPLLIAVLGVVIGGMIVALYMPIFSIANAVQGSGK